MPFFRVMFTSLRLIRPQWWRCHVVRGPCPSVVPPWLLSPGLSWGGAIEVSRWLPWVSEEEKKKKQDWSSRGIFSENMVWNHVWWYGCDIIFWLLDVIRDGTSGLCCEHTWGISHNMVSEVLWICNPSGNSPSRKETEVIGGQRRMSNRSSEQNREEANRMANTPRATFSIQPPEPFRFFQPASKRHRTELQDMHPGAVQCQGATHPLSALRDHGKSWKQTCLFLEVELSYWSSPTSLGILCSYLTPDLLTLLFI